MSSQYCYTLVLIIPKRFFLFCFLSIPKKVAIFAILRIVLTTEMKVCVQAPVKAVKNLSSEASRLGPKKNSVSGESVAGGRLREGRLSLIINGRKFISTVNLLILKMYVE